MADENGTCAQDIVLALVKGSIESCGPLGAVISNLLFETNSARKMRRFQRLLKELGELVQKVTEEKLDYDFLKTDEFADIAEKCIHNSVNTATQAKLNAYRDILIGSAMKDHPAYDQIEHFLARIDFLAEQHFQVLRVFLETKDKVLRYSDIVEKVPECGPTVIDLTNLGLLYKPNVAIFGGDEATYAPEPLDKEEFTLSTLGERFVNFVLSGEGVQ